ncbi:MAG: hypothetical protein IKM48_08175 [Clostridia bacterium]|nr:hypothetical protein [Clostridia bacterium]
MTLVLITCILTCIGLITLVFTKPAVRIGHEQISIYWLPPLLGALVLAVSGTLSWQEIFTGLTAPTAMNPIKILILFFSMTLISVFLDAAGFFRHLAERMLSRAKGSQLSLFLTLYLTVSVLTVFTSNDIIVLTFTPFICYFTRNAKIDPMPYLFCEFIAANTWSMILIIGNPTNIYLGTGAGLEFFDYFKVMALPTLLAGAGSLAALLLLFYKKLRQPLKQSEPATHRLDRPLVALGVTHLSLCIVFLVLSSYIDLPMWIIALAACLILFATATCYLLARQRSLVVIGETLKRAPLEMIPFVLSMFILVLSLEKYGVTAKIADLLSGFPAAWSYGITSFLAANLMNNIPMSVLYSGITAGLSGATQSAALYASVIGSNLGAFFTPIGALAGIMWMQLLRAHQIKLSFGRFSRYGAAVALPALLLAILGLVFIL